MEKLPAREALRIVWATPIGGGIAGFVIGFALAIGVAVVSVFTDGADLAAAVPLAFAVGAMAIPFGAAVGAGSAVAGGLVIAALRLLGERPSTRALVVAGTVGTLPGSLVFVGVTTAAPYLAIVFVVVIAALGAVGIRYLLRADLALPTPEGHADAHADDPAPQEGGL